MPQGLLILFRFSNILFSGGFTRPPFLAQLTLASARPRIQPQACSTDPGEPRQTPSVEAQYVHPCDSSDSGNVFVLWHVTILSIYTQHLHFWKENSDFACVVCLLGKSKGSNKCSLSTLSLFCSLLIWTSLKMKIHFFFTKTVTFLLKQFHF